VGSLRKYVGRHIVTPRFLRANPQPVGAARAYVAGRELAPAVVCEVGWVNGLGAIRSLGRTGVPVIALDHRPWALGFRSRYSLPVLAPDPLEDEEGFVASLLELGEALGRPAPIFPTHDEHLNSLARHRDELAGRFLFPFPGWDVLEPLQSKRYQLETAQRIGVAIPRTVHPRSLDEALAAAGEIGFPVLVKPSDNVVFKRLYRRQAFYCTQPSELEETFRLVADYEPMLQEFVAGGDDCLWTLGAYVTPDGDALACFSGRKLRQTREHMGSARVGEAVWDDEVVESGLAMLRALGFHGIAQVEWKRDPRNGVLKLIEVNPRLWQWHGLTGACGVDVALTAYRHLVGESVSPARTDGCRKRWSISLMAKQGTAIQRPPYVEAVLAVDDPKPSIVHTGRFVLHALGLR
jgi:predicted ATP-grasp superfamily ATP-dependent carboligase